MSEAEAQEVVSIEFNPIRCGFHGSEPVWVRDVLNLGVSPVTAIELVRSWGATPPPPPLPRPSGSIARICCPLHSSRPYAFCWQNVAESEASSN